MVKKARLLFFRQTCLKCDGLSLLSSCDLCFACEQNVFLNSRLGQISHTIFWGAEGLGEGCVKMTPFVSCLEWLTCLFLFIMVEFEKGLYSPDLKMLLIFFSCYESLPKGYNVQMSKGF